MAKKIALLNMFCGFRMDSGVVNSGADIFQRISNPQALDVSEKKNIVIKLRGSNLTPCEKIKFSDLKKEQTDAEKLVLVRDALKKDLSAKLILDMYKKG